MFTVKFLFIYSERERESVCVHAHEQRRSRERGRERIPSRLHTVSIESDVGLDSMNHEIMT